MFVGVHMFTLLLSQCETVRLCSHASRNDQDMCTKKCVVRRFRRRANVIECTYTNLDSTV